MNFDEIINENDDTVVGKCCENVYSVEETKIAGQDYFCFKVETKDEQWTICDLESNKIHAWRNNINAAVIVWDVKNKGIFDIK